MPYNRDEVVASVTEFYNFLTTQLHFYPSELKTSPPAGWPQITPPSTDRQRKSDTAIDLLRHFPYLPGGNGQEKWVYDHTICADYTDKTVEQGIELELLGIVEDCPWEKLKDSSRTEHIVSLATPNISDAGSFICLDTLDGEVIVWDVGSSDYLSFDNAGGCYDWLRKQYEELKIFSVPGSFDVPAQVWPLNDRHQDFKDDIKSLEWPPGSGIE